MRKISLIMFLLIPFLGFSQVRNGVIYDDVDGNAVLDKKDKGLPGILVSDGLNVVRSDAQGHFSLPENSKSRFVFVSTPAGYLNTTPFYIQSDSKAFEFGLKRDKDQNQQFLHITDVETFLYKDWIDNMKEYVKNYKPAFIVSTGDICYPKGLKFNGENVTSSKMGTRVVTTLGNHDLVDGKYGEELFESLFGPVWYSFDVGEVHFVVTPMLGGDRAPSYTSDDLVAWLKNDLDSQPKGKPVVIFNHDLWFQTDDMLFKSKNDSISFNDYNMKAWIYGHWHVHLINQFKESGMKAYCSSSPDKGGINHSPSAFRIFDIGVNGDIQSDTRYTYSTNGRAVLSAVQCGDKTKITANIYKTSAFVKSAEIITGKKRYPMTMSTDWSWNAEIPAYDGEVKCVVVFEDGEKIERAVEVEDSYKWIANTGSNIFMTSPIIGEDLVYTATIDSDKAEKCWVVALDKKDGSLKWKFKTNNSVKNNIALCENTVLACDMEGVLYAIDAVSGKELWRQQLHDFILSPYDQGICVKDGIVYAGQGKGLSAVRVSDGEILWKNNAWNGGEGTLSTNVVSDTILFVSSNWRGRYAHNIKDGKLLWSANDNGISFNASSPVIFNGNLYFTSTDYIFEVDPQTGKKNRMIRSDYNLSSASTPYIDSKMMIQGTTNSGVVAYGMDNLKPLWVFKTEPVIFYTVQYTQDNESTVEGDISVVGDKVYFGASDGYLYCIGKNDGKLIKKHNIGSPLFGKVVIDKEDLYVNDFAGNVFKIRL